MTTNEINNLYACVREAELEISNIFKVKFPSEGASQFIRFLKHEADPHNVKLPKDSSISFIAIANEWINNNKI